MSGGHLPPWLDPEGAGKRQRQAQNRRSGAMEARLASDLGGRVQSGSGSSWRAKADVRDDEYTVECKYTSKSSYSLTMEVVDKIIKAAEQQGREPMLVIDFQSHGVRAVVHFEDLPFDPSS